MHQLAQRRIVFALRIDIYDVGAVAERLSGLLNHAVNVVDGKSCLQDIPFCNENNVGFPQNNIILSKRKYCFAFVYILFTFYGTITAQSAV